MSGLMGGSWRRCSPAGHLRVPGRCAGRRRHDGLVGTQPAGHLQPRQLPTRLEHRHVVDEEEASKSCAIAAGALNLEGPEFPGALRPGEEFPIAGSGRRYVLLREGPPELVFCLCDVDVFVGVDPTVTRGPTCAIVDLAIVLLSSWSMAGRADSTATGLLPASYQVTARSVGRADGDGRDLGRQIKAKARSR